MIHLCRPKPTGRKIKAVLPKSNTPKAEVYTADEWACPKGHQFWKPPKPLRRVRV